MWTVTGTWGDWRFIIAALREKAEPYMIEHADTLEQRLEQHEADEATVRLTLSDDLFLRSVSWAGWVLGLKLPYEQG